MSKCATCERWWQKLTPFLGNGTCMLDGSKAKSSDSCGYHTNLIPVETDDERAPDKRRSRKHA